MESPSNQIHPIQTKLIFNPTAGAAAESPVQLMEVIDELQARNFIPEAYLIESSNDLSSVVQDAYQKGIRMFVVCGGDGTIESVAGALIGTDATLGIIPTGTRNNVAFSLGIPEEIAGAVSLLQNGRKIKVDVGFATCGEHSRIFLETCSIGLLSALFPAADDIQRGNLGRIGDFLAALIASPLAEMHLIMDNRPEISMKGHVVLVANLPYVGPRFQITPAGFFNDGLLDVLVFPDQSKFDLLNNIAQMTIDNPDDPHIRRYQAQTLDIFTNPPMPVMADGFSIGEGPLHISIQHCALSVMVGEEAPAVNPGIHCVEDKLGEFPNTIIDAEPDGFYA